MKSKILSAALIIFVFLSIVPSLSRAEKNFDELLKQATEEKQAEWDVYEGEIQRIDAEFDRLWRERKAEIEQKWDEALRSTNKEWVDYSGDLNARSAVDFEKGVVDVTAIVPAIEKDIIPRAEDLVADQLKKILSAENDSRQRILENQIALDPGKTVTPDTTTAFVEKAKKQVVIDKKPFVPKDGVPRVKVTVRFNLLPNHLQIRAKKFHAEIGRYSSKFGIPPDLVMAVVHTESYFNPLAVSPADAHGLMQLIPKYGARDAYRMVYKKDRVVPPEYLYIPHNNIELGSAYLSLLRDRVFNSITDKLKQLYLVICAYNWGPGAVKRNIVNKNNISTMTSDQVYQTLRQQTPEETSNYLKRVTERMKLYAKLFR